MITTKEMKELEEEAENLGITKSELMENAGRAVVEDLQEKFPDLDQKKVLILCGAGNNGGDGFVAARYLYDICKIDVLFLGEEEKLSPESSSNYDALHEINGEIIVHPDDERLSLINAADYDIIIDAMLGTGLNGPLREPFASIVLDINCCEVYTLSVDIPTGIDPDTGNSQDEMYVKADKIITFHDTKPGLKQFEEKVKVVDIGIPL